MSTILFVSHKEKQCGVHQYGLDVAQALEKSDRYSFVYAECSSAEDLCAVASETMPAAIIYNYYPSTQPWLQTDVMSRVRVPHIGIVHEVTQQVADSMTNEFFDYHIAPDPTLSTKNPIVFKTGRLIPQYNNSFDAPKIPTIGSFGFATSGKGFRRLVIAVQEEFDQAIIRLHIPAGDFANSSTEDMAKQCQALVIKDGVKLVVTHDFYSTTQLLDFLAQNTVNAFFYDKCEGRGISSVIEKALAVQRPIAITRSHMFRHVLSGNPPICIEKTSASSLSQKQKATLKAKMASYLGNTKNEFPLEWLIESETSLNQIIANGTAPLDPFRNQWNEANLISDYERIMDAVLSRSLAVKQKPTVYKKPSFAKRAIGRARRVWNQNRPF